MYNSVNSNNKQNEKEKKIWLNSSKAGRLCSQGCCYRQSNRQLRTRSRILQLGIQKNKSEAWFKELADSPRGVTRTPHTVADLKRVAGAALLPKHVGLPSAGHVFARCLGSGFCAITHTTQE
eukprot:scaffold5234_cov131-Cylindrotheca_fusiformis.AAC.5